MHRDAPYICYCFRVSEARIREAVRRLGLRTLAEVQRATGACTGCRTCRPDVEAILAEEQVE